MARGQLWRTKVRNWYWQKKKEWQAYFNAKEENYKKNPQMFWREVAAGILKNIDPVETAAIIGSTYVVHDVILKSQPFVDSLKTFRPTLVGAGGGLIGIFIANLVGEEIKSVEMPDDLVMWFVSFAIAYFAIKHGVELLNVAKTFFGIGSIA